MWSTRRLASRLPASMVAVLAAVVLSAGVVAATVVDRASAPSNSATVAGDLALAQLSPAQQAAEAHKAPETAAAPSTTTAPSSPRPTGAEAPPLPGHQTPGAVVAPFKAGRTDWSGVSNGVTLHMVMSPASPRAGEPVTFTVEASTAAGLCCGLTLMTGDGGGDLFPPAPADQHSGCAAQEPTSNSVRAELHHVYNKAGRWNFSLTARTGGICTPTESGYGSLVGTLEIGGGGSAATSQGPAQPTVHPASVYPYAPGVITLNAEARDDDGYVDRLTVDWGDGSATETYRNPKPCTTTASGWPEASYTMLPLWMGVGPVIHRYASDTPPAHPRPTARQRARRAQPAGAARGRGRRGPSGRDHPGERRPRPHRPPQPPAGPAGRSSRRHPWETSWHGCRRPTCPPGGRAPRPRPLGVRTSGAAVASNG